MTTFTISIHSVFLQSFYILKIATKLMFALFLLPLRYAFAWDRFFAEVNIFNFWPTMDYSPWFDFRESKKRFEKRMPP